MNNLRLPDVKDVNINHKDSWQRVINLDFVASFKAQLILNIFLTVFSLGIFLLKKLKKSRKKVAQALAARKITNFRRLQDKIGEIRLNVSYTDPRKALNSIFNKILVEKTDTSETALEYKALYYPSELFLFITNPIRDNRSIRLFHIRSKNNLDYIKMWHELKKKARMNQYRQIQNINFCNKALKVDRCLTSEGIHDRLSRTSISRKNLFQLTKFRELAAAFQELVIAYQDFEDINDTNPELYKLIDMLSKTSKKDIETLQTYLASKYIPSDLPLVNRKQLIDLGNQQDTLSCISEEEQFNLCALVLNKYQWDFLISIQKVSDITIKLLDWAFAESFNAAEGNKSFFDEVSTGLQDTIGKNTRLYPLIFQRIIEEKIDIPMTVDYAKELKREWPEMSFFVQDEKVFQLERSNALTLEVLFQVFHAINQIACNDIILSSILQQSLSQKGKQAFTSAIEDGELRLLGQKSEYFLPILINSNISLKKLSNCEIEMNYTFEQLVKRKNKKEELLSNKLYLVVCQKIIKKNGEWVAPVDHKVEVLRPENTI